MFDHLVAIIHGAAIKLDTITGKDWFHDLLPASSCITSDRWNGFCWDCE